MRRFAVILILGAAQAASAQDASPYDGKWTAKYANAKGVPMQADVVIGGAGGSWDTLGGTIQSDRCIFGAAPIVVLSATPDELVFVVKRSEALAGCTDSRLKFKRADEKTLQGEFGNGRAVTLLR